MDLIPCMKKAVQCLFYSVFSVDNDSCDQRLVVCSGSPQTRTVPVPPLEPWLMDRVGDSMLVLMESGNK